MLFSRPSSHKEQGPRRLAEYHRAFKPTALRMAGRRTCISKPNGLAPDTRTVLTAIQSRFGVCPQGMLACGPWCMVAFVRAPRVHCVARRFCSCVATRMSRSSRRVSAFCSATRTHSSTCRGSMSILFYVQTRSADTNCRFCIISYEYVAQEPSSNQALSGEIMWLTLMQHRNQPNRWFSQQPHCTCRQHTIAGIFATITITRR